MRNRQYTTHVALSDPQGDHAAHLYADPFALEPTPERTEAGVQYAIDHTFHIDEVDAATLAYYAHPRNAIVTLHLSDGSSRALGTALCPVRAYIYPMVQGYALRVEGLLGEGWMG